MGPGERSSGPIPLTPTDRIIWIAEPVCIYYLQALDNVSVVLYQELVDQAGFDPCMSGSIT
jgi:hypothetical protein